MRCYVVGTKPNGWEEGSMWDEMTSSGSRRDDACDRSKTVMVETFLVDARGKPPLAIGSLCPINTNTNLFMAVLLS